MSIEQVQSRIRAIQALIGETNRSNEAFGEALQAAQAGSAAAGSPERFRGLIQDASARTGVSADLIAAVIRAESGFNPKAVSPVGAQGLMQLMPGTAAQLGVTDPFDPRQNVLGGAEYLREQLTRFGSLEKAIAAYNAGPGAVQKYGGVPPYPETKSYVQRVLGYLRSPESRRE